MCIGKVQAVNCNPPKSVSFKKNYNSGNYENPVSRGTERNLAILSGVASSAVFGAVVAGLTSCFTGEEMAKNAESKVKEFCRAKKTAVWVGAAAAGIALLVTLPAKVYNTKVNAFVKQKEVDVFSRDRSLKSNLTEEVDKEVQDPDVSLDKKLDDNLKLQMANRGGALGIANITPKA